MIKPKTPYEDIPFYHTNIDTRLLTKKIQNNPEIYEIFKKKQNITNDVNQEIIYRMRGSQENFVTIFITGEQSRKKSSTAMSIAETYDETNFSVKRICFRYEEYKEKLQQSKPKEWLQMDEQAFKHGVGSIRLVHEIQDIIEQIRKRQNSLIICSPELKFLDEKVFTFILEMIDDKIIVICPHNKKPHETRNCGCYYENNYKVVYAETRSLVKRNGNYIGYYTAPIKWNSPLWQEYIKIKDEHIEKLKDGKTQESPYRNIAKNILSKPDNEIYLKNRKTIKLLLSEEYPNLTVQEVQLCLEAIIMEITKKNENKQT